MIESPVTPAGGSTADCALRGYSIVVVGASLGGLSALETLLAGLPAAFPVPVAVVQHRSAQNVSVLSALLRRHTELPVSEPFDKQLATPGCIYLAPPDYHLLVDSGCFALSTEAPVRHARPSIDVLFESAAEAYGAGVVGVVLTGASSDGSLGARRIAARGGTVIVQDPATAECAIMPRAAIAAADPRHVVPLSEIAPLLVRLCENVRN